VLVALCDIQIHSIELPIGEAQRAERRARSHFFVEPTQVNHQAAVDKEPQVTVGRHHERVVARRVVDETPMCRTRKVDPSSGGVSTSAGPDLSCRAVPGAPRPSAEPLVKVRVVAQTVIVARAVQPQGEHRRDNTSRDSVALIGQTAEIVVLIVEEMTLHRQRGAGVARAFCETEALLGDVELAKVPVPLCHEDVQAVCVVDGETQRGQGQRHCRQRV